MKITLISVWQINRNITSPVPKLPNTRSILEFGVLRGTANVSLFSPPPPQQIALTSPSCLLTPLWIVTQPSPLGTVNRSALWWQRMTSWWHQLKTGERERQIMKGAFEIYPACHFLLTIKKNVLLIIFNLDSTFRSIRVYDVWNQSPLNPSSGAAWRRTIITGYWLA